MKKQRAKPSPPKRAARAAGVKSATLPARLTVASIMRSPVMTVRPSDTAAEVLEIGRRHRIRHFPVLDNEALVGLVTDRNLQTATTAPRVFTLLLDLISSMDRARVDEIMAHEVITTTPDTPLADAATLMVQRGIGCLPVIQGGKLVGIVTQEDFMKVLAQA